MTDIESLCRLTEAVEAAGADIAPTYLEYVQLSFAIATDCGEAGRDLVLDDEDDRLEACTAGVVQGIIHDDLTAGTHRVDLLHAAVAAAHAGSHDHQDRFIHVLSPP